MERSSLILEAIFRQQIAKDMTFSYYFHLSLDKKVKKKNQKSNKTICHNKIFHPSHLVTKKTKREELSLSFLEPQI